MSFWLDDDISSPRIDDDRTSLTSQLRKTKSMDASCLDVRAMNDISSPVLNYPLSRAKSDFNLNASSQSLNRSKSTIVRLMTTKSRVNWRVEKEPFAPDGSQRVKGAVILMLFVWTRKRIDVRRGTFCSWPLTCLWLYRRKIVRS